MFSGRNLRPGFRNCTPNMGPKTIHGRSEALASSASSEGRTYKCVMENVSLCLSSSSNRHLGVRHSTFESLRLGLSSQSIASGFLHFWDSLNFKKDRELWESRFFSSMKSSKQDYNQANSSGMTYQQLKLNSPFQAEQQMEANFSGSSSTSRQNQKIDVGGRLIKRILQRSETA
ncbi:hypothetical protein YC2023_016374 [Brassica napus]